MEKPPNPREGFPCDLWGAASPAPSCQSVKSDRSMDRPIFFKGGSSSPDISWAGLACDLCTGKRRRAVKSCLTCTASYCETHVRQHYTVAVLQRHTLVEADGDQVIPPPVELTEESVDTTSLTLSWREPHGLDQTPHFLVSYSSPGTEPQFISTASHSTVLSNLQPGTEYTVRVCTVLENGGQSEATSKSVCTKLSPPGNLNISSVGETSVSLSWDRPTDMEGVPHTFRVTWGNSRGQRESFTTEENLTVLSQLRPGTEYSISVCTVLHSNGLESDPVCTTIQTEPSAPGRVRVEEVKSRSVRLRWDTPTEMEGVSYTFSISYSCDGEEPKEVMSGSNSNTTVLSDLRAGVEYSFSVSTVLHNGSRSRPSSAQAHTKPSAPGRVRVEEVRSRSVRLCWCKPSKMEGVSYTFSISYSCDGEEPKEVTTGSNSNTTVLSDLRAGVEYSFSVSTVLHNGSRSRPSSAQAHTKTCLEELVCDLGLKHHLKEKLTLSAVLEIDGETIRNETVGSLASLPWCFLKKLMMMNMTARSVRCAASQESASQDLDSMDDITSSEEFVVNPLDLVTALFLCSDSFFQQEMALKMSMCQFSVPLLLPNCDTQQPTLMLWAMRDIVKSFRPHSLAEQRGFVEGSIVLTELPLISFVRLGTSSLSKSQILNQVLSNPQQYHDTFIHHNMTGGNAPRRISDGLVEVSWYLPSGDMNSDIFPEPVAVANLRGDISAFAIQFSFLCQTSAAVFVFCDDLESNSEFLKAQNVSDRIYLICHSACRDFNKSEFQKYMNELQLKPDHILMKGRMMNDAEFVRKLHLVLNNVVKMHSTKTSIEQMSSTTHGLGIPVDEDNFQCQIAKQKADEITVRITDILLYKESQLPLQGEMCKELAKLEKEECRLKEAGDANIELYKSELCKKKQGLREKQRDHGVSDAMSRFISALSSPREQRSYFLKWLKINLDNLSLTHLSGLRQKYKELCQDSSENRGFITDLDRQISSSSLGVEHFLREMGQLYEATSSLPENHPSRQQMQNLPRLCAQLLLDGFPVELVDGDASNIPLQWMKAVLTELHSLTQSNSKIRVVTVLGVQSSGKSTLLNTMFGVQFAVSSGRCTRGAFMLLIRLKKNFRKDLGCDFLMVIDTEGLKSPELAQLADSYEHDNELATLVVGLSDITIVNITMENCAEMKDILQIVVHAFLRMKEVGKKPCCHFVHQNVADVSAYEKNLRDRQLLLKQLNEMTHVAARMEGRTENKIFTDVMHYDPERNTWYIPGLWRGNPPMAPVNTGYSEAVKEFKSRMIEALKELKGTRPAHTIPEFLEWTESLWKAVKYENFIFSFQNSLVADAYTKLCTEFNKWEWAFRKHMHNWVTEAETRVSNFGTVTAQHASSLDDLLTNLQKKASFELDREEKQILDKVTEYFKRQEGHIYLVERYREEFMNSAKSLKKEMQPVVMMKLESAVDLKKAMAIVEDGKKNHKTIMEGNVLKLLDMCREAKTQMSDQQLEQEFEQMWKEMMETLSFRGLQRQNVGQEIYSLLRSNLDRKGGSVSEMLSEASRLEECGREPFIIGCSDKNIAVTHGVFNQKEHIRKTQELCDSITNLSRQFIADGLEERSDFHKTYILELLGMIDEHVETHRNLQLTADFEASLKIHICGHAAREFQRMHDDFIRDNDPQQCLEKFKQQFCNDFKDLLYKRDQCRSKAQEFTRECLEPAVREYVTKALGPDIVDEFLTGSKANDFSTRSSFQFSILKQLLTEDNFEKLVQYIRCFEDFVKEWIFSQILDHFSREECSIANIESSHLREAIRKIKVAVESTLRTAAGRSEEDMNICLFIKDICSNLSDILVLPKDALNAVMVLNSAKTQQFSDWLLCFIEDMEQSLSAEFHRNKDVRTRLTTLPFKPQDELFRRVFGCGKQCPFCMAPCEAGGKSHTEHFTSVHRPEGLGDYRWENSKKLSTDICSSCIASEVKFRSRETKGRFHPYKNYRKFYPDWRIQADTSIQASAYWKYVFAKFNTQFAKQYEAEPADLPAEWKSITKDQAIKSLVETFKRKRQEGD